METVSQVTMTGFDRVLFVLGGTAVTIGSLASVAVFIAAAFIASRLFQRLLGRVYTRRGIEEGVQYALNRLLHYAVMAIGVFLALDNLGVSITALAGLGAILAVGIGFGLQNIAQNFVSGLILLLERPVKRGDFVEVAGTSGTVRSIHARATVVTTLDGVDILVPNGQFITEPVVNETFGGREIRIKVEVGVAYGSDTELVRQVLEQVAADHRLVKESPPPRVFFTEFGESSLNFSLLVWVADPITKYPVGSDLRFAIDREFRAAGIEIPFPQRDLHLRSSDVRLWKD